MAEVSLWDLIKNDMAIKEGATAVSDWWDSLNTAQKVGMSPVGWPVTDIAGLAGDIQMYAEQPESRGLINYIGTGASLLPFVPAMSGVIKASDMAKKPLYHWTDAPEFDVFEPSQRGKIGPGVYFSDKYDYGKRYAPSGRVIDARIMGDVAERPEIDLAQKQSMEQLKQAGGTVTTRDWKELTNKLLQEQGFAGKQVQDEFLAFDPKDISIASQNAARPSLMDAIDANYRGAHLAPSKEGANTLDNLSDIYPDDIYSPRGLQYYGTGSDFAGDKESWDIIKRMKGNPDAEVKIYRAVPKGVKDINAGDWVAISKDYAKQHGESVLRGDYDIIESTAKAGDLTSDGGAITEWGYFPN